LNEHESSNNSVENQNFGKNSEEVNVNSDAGNGKTVKEVSEEEKASDIIPDHVISDTTNTSHTRKAEPGNLDLDSKRQSRDSDSGNSSIGQSDYGNSSISQSDYGESIKGKSFDSLSNTDNTTSSSSPSNSSSSSSGTTTTLPTTGIDILMTHGPPLGIGDRLSGGDRVVGCVELLASVRQRIRPKFHVFGHVHESNGCWTDGTTTFINAAICNGMHYPMQKVWKFDVELPEGVDKREALKNWTRFDK